MEEGSDYPGNLQGPPSCPTVQLQLAVLALGMFFCFFALSGPCFDRESTPYQSPNLTYSSGAAQMLCPPENLLWASSNPIAAASLFSAPALPLVQICSALMNIHVYLPQYTRWLFLGQEHIHKNCSGTSSSSWGKAC